MRSAAPTTTSLQKSSQLQHNTPQYLSYKEGKVRSAAPAEVSLWKSSPSQTQTQTQTQTETQPQTQTQTQTQKQTQTQTPTQTQAQTQTQTQITTLPQYFSFRYEADLAKDKFSKTSGPPLLF